MLQWVATHGEYTANTSWTGKGFSVLLCFVYLFICFLQMRIQNCVGVEWGGDLGGARGRGEYGLNNA